MLVTQVAALVNAATKEMLGETGVLAEDLSNAIDTGNALQNLGDNALDNYVRKLHDVVGKMVFVDRTYSGRAPSTYMDGWEYGAIMLKMSADLPEAQENESWELEDGEVYEQDTFHKPAVNVKGFSKRTTFEIPISTVRRQVLSAFNTGEQLNAFVSMLYNAVRNSMTLKNDSLIMRTINNFIAETVYKEYGSAALTTKGGNRAINLLALYNALKDTELPATENTLTNLDFLKFCAYYIRDYVKRLENFSTLFNIEGKGRFTPRDRMNVILLDRFASAADIYLQSDTFHNEFTRMPAYDSVAYWQGTGESYDFADISRINTKTSDGNSVNVSGVLGFIRDRDALGVTNLDPRVTNHWNGRAEFWNEWHKVDAGYFNDFQENGVVFFIA